MRILVVGGAGYVGSAACAWLLDRGHEVWVLDDLSTGRRDLALGARLVIGRAGDRAVTDPLFASARFDGVMHFAARSLVAESVAKPELYRENNFEQTRSLLDAMLAHGVRRFVFSSTAAVFGDPGESDLTENAPKRPINPYGETKLAVERMLEELSKTRGLQAVALRYFNAAGAEDGLRVGECHEPETHLIPNVLRAAWEQREVTVFGDDYPTPDGTCVRDYVHVSDLARAHEAALSKLAALPEGAGFFRDYNLGSATGSTVLEIVRACERETGREIRVKRAARRAGDPPRLVADSRRATAELGFRNREDALGSIIRSAWAWERRRREPRPAVFLDRDGTINADPGYLRRAEQMNVLPGVPEALGRLQSAGYRLVVVSNQSGVGRGLIEADEIPRIHARLDELLRPAAAVIDRYELCFHRPEAGCPCRKPKPELLARAARELNLDLARSFMVGDKRTDVQAGRAAGCRASILVRTGAGLEAERELAPGEASLITDSLKDATDWILAQGT